MKPSPCRPRRLADPRGAILIICLLLVLIASFLGGLLLLLARTEATVSATMGGSVQAMNAAEYGIELAINSLNPTQQAAPFPAQTLAPGIRATPGLRDGSSPGAVNQGAFPCPPGYDLRLGCTGYLFTSTGWAKAWLVTTASAQVQAAEDIYHGCGGTEYSC